MKHLLQKFVLFDLILYVPSTISQLNRDGSSWVEADLLQKSKCSIFHNIFKYMIFQRSYYGVSQLIHIVSPNRDVNMQSEFWWRRSGAEFDPVLTDNDLKLYSLGYF